MHLYVAVRRCVVIPKSLMITRIGEDIKVRAGALLGTEELLLPSQSRRVAAILNVLGMCKIPIVLASCGIGWMLTGLLILSPGGTVVGFGSVLEHLLLPGETGSLFGIVAVALLARRWMLDVCKRSGRS